MSTWAGEGGNIWCKRCRCPTSPSPKQDEVIVALLKMTRQHTKHLLKKNAGVPSTKPWDLDPMVLDAPGKGEGIQVEISCDSKTVVDWISGKARQEMVNHDHQVEEKQDDLALSTVKKPMHGRKRN